MTGAVLSMLSVTLALDPLSATSRAVPISWFADDSSDTTTPACRHETELPGSSVAVKLTVTFRLNQPCAFGWPSVSPVISGAVLSILNNRVAGALVSPALSRASLREARRQARCRDRHRGFGRQYLVCGSLRAGEEDVDERHCSRRLIHPCNLNDDVVVVPAGGRSAPERR